MYLLNRIYGYSELGDVYKDKINALVDDDLKAILYGILIILLMKIVRLILMFMLIRIIRRIS